MAPLHLDLTVRIHMLLHDAVQRDAIQIISSESLNALFTRARAGH